MFLDNNTAILMVSHKSFHTVQVLDDRVQGMRATPLFKQKLVLLL